MTIISFGLPSPFFGRPLEARSVLEKGKPLALSPHLPVRTPPTTSPMTLGIPLHPVSFVAFFIKALSWLVHRIAPIPYSFVMGPNTLGPFGYATGMGGIQYGFPGGEVLVSGA